MENEKNGQKLGEKTLKEIWEIPESIRTTVLTRENRDQIMAVAQRINESGCTSIYCLGSGTSYHAGLVATYWFSKYARIPTHCELAPEFPYLVEPIVKEKHCMICISQSGESELTLYSAEVSKANGALVIGLTNNAESPLAKIVGDDILLTKAGKEKSVLATKTYASQLVLLTALAIDLAFIRQTISERQHYELWDELKAVPRLIELTLPIDRKSIKKLAPYFKFAKQCFVIGAGPDYANCMEAALKLKEGARIFAQAYSTAEFPHGPITLAESHMAFCLVLVPHKDDVQPHKDILKLIKRLKERGITILAIKSNEESLNELDFTINVSRCTEIFQPILSIIPVQLLVVEIATIQNINCDTPKFLSKVSKL